MCTCNLFALTSFASYSAVCFWPPCLPHLPKEGHPGHLSIPSMTDNGRNILRWARLGTHVGLSWKSEVLSTCHPRHVLHGHTGVPFSPASGRMIELGQGLDEDMVCQDVSVTLKRTRTDGRPGVILQDCVPRVDLPTPNPAPILAM